jgi:hypothetical protein
VALTHFIVVEIVCRGDLNAPCAKLHKLKLINIFTEDAKIKSEWRDDALPDTGSGKVKAIWEGKVRNGSV